MVGFGNTRVADALRRRTILMRRTEVGVDRMVAIAMSAAWSAGKP